MRFERSASYIEGVFWLLLTGGIVAVLLAVIVICTHGSAAVAIRSLAVGLPCIGVSIAGMRVNWYRILRFISDRLSEASYQLNRALGREKAPRCEQVIGSIRRCIQEQYDDYLEPTMRTLPRSHEFVADEELCRAIIPLLVILFATVSEPSFYGLKRGTLIAKRFADEYYAQKLATCKAMADTILKLLREAAAQDRPRACLMAVFRAVSPDRRAAERWAQDCELARELRAGGVDEYGICMMLGDVRLKLPSRDQFPEKGYDVMITTLRSVLHL